MCWERLNERWMDDVTAKETRENPVASDDELEPLEASVPSEESVEVEEELARV